MYEDIITIDHTISSENLSNIDKLRQVVLRNKLFQQVYNCDVV